MRIAQLSFLLILYPFILSAQDSKKIMQAAKQKITKEFPTTRFLDLEYEVLTAGEYSSKMHGVDYEKGKISDVNRLKLALNYPIYKTTKFVITPSIRYRFETMTFNNVVNDSQVYPHIYHGKKEDFHYISPSINGTYFSKLFGKHAIYTLNISGDASEKGFEHIKGTLIGLLMLKRDRQALMSVGAVILMDKRASVPIVPLFSYQYKFVNSEWSLDMMLPAYFYFRKTMFKDGRLSLGAGIDGGYFYGYLKYSGLSDTYNVAKREVKFGLTYEHYLNKYFIASIRGGVTQGFNWSVTEKTSRQEIIKYSPKANMYFNVGLSYNL